MYETIRPSEPNWLFEAPPSHEQPDQDIDSARAVRQVRVWPEATTTIARPGAWAEPDAALTIDSALIGTGTRAQFRRHGFRDY